MDNTTAQIIGIVETSVLPDAIKIDYIEKLTKDGTSTEIIEGIKNDLRSSMATDAKKAGFEPANDDPKVIKAVANYEASTNDLNNRYTATMQDLEERIDKVMNDTSAELEKIEIQIAKEELTA